MRFEFDPAKSQSNKEKHGIDFIEAQALWFGSVLELKGVVTPESRTVIIGKIGDRHWTAVITKRGENTRIISVRRSRDEEKTEYEKRNQADFS